MRNASPYRVSVSDGADVQIVQIVSTQFDNLGKRTASYRGKSAI